MNGVLLDVRNLCISFTVNQKVIPAVDGVTIAVGRGETVVVAGESGSGKTVTAFAIARLLPPSAHVLSGEIIFDGNDMRSCSEHALVAIRGKEIAYIFQEPAAYLNPVFTIGNQLMETYITHRGISRREAYSEAANILRLVHIDDADRVLMSYPHQLSGGMNQRVSIAMALACRPKLLIADEPTTSLDVTIEAQILALLMELKEKQGFSLLFITHNLAVARKIADRICVMYKGKVVEEGSRESLFTGGRHPHTQELLRAYEKIGKL